MRQGTTPTLIIETNINLSDFDSVMLTIKQGATQYDLKELTQGEGTISAKLTQEQTLSFDSTSDVSLQFKAKVGETVTASNIVSLPVCEILNKEVME